MILYFLYVDVTKYDKQGNLQKKEFIFLTAQRNESSSKWGAWQQASGMMAEAGITYERDHNSITRTKQRDQSESGASILILRACPQWHSSSNKAVPLHSFFK